jgi:hypothetical protein
MRCHQREDSVRHFIAGTKIHARHGHFEITKFIKLREQKTFTIFANGENMKTYTIFRITYDDIGKVVCEIETRACFSLENRM